MYLSKKGQGISSSPTLAIDAKFKALLADGVDVVGFGAGEPDFDTPAFIKQAAIDAIIQGKTKYTPAAGTMELRKAICDKLQRENKVTYTPAEIVVSNGAKHSLTNIFAAILNPGDEVIIPAPFWVSYPEMVKLSDGVPTYLITTEEQGFKFDATQLMAAITPKTRAIILNSPSNPTGMLYTKAELQQIADIAVKNNIYVVSDEIYEHLIYEGEGHTSIATLGEEIKKLTIIVNGVSKSYAMTGWRIGYTACDKSIASIMANIQSHATSNPCSISQAAALAALTGSQEFVADMKKAFVKRLNYMVDRINNMAGVSCIKPHGAFYVMMNVKELFGKEYYGKMINNSDELCDLLLDKANLALVPGTGFGADGYVRWSYATKMETIEEGLNRLQRFVEENN